MERYGYVVDESHNTAAGRQAECGTGGFFEAGGGCGACNRSGYSGRTGIFEIRDIRSQVAGMLLGQAARFDPVSAEAVFCAALHGGEIGARSMREDGIIKASAGLTTPEEVFGATMDASWSPESKTHS